MVVLREYTVDDIDRLVLLANNMKVSQYLIDTFPYPYTYKDAEWWISIGCKENSATTRAIEYNNELVGSIGITPQVGWKRHQAEIGYWLGENFWNKGITTQALKIMTDYSFSDLQIKKLFAPVVSTNKYSIRVLEKCGFKLEGILRREVYKNEQFYDIHHYAKFRDA